MALHRFFLDGQVLSDEAAERFPLTLSAKDRRHARVLRLRPGEHIAVIDGAGIYYECEVIEFVDELCVRIAARKNAPTSPFALTLCLGMLKGAKFDDVIRSATELGVETIVPFAAARSVERLNADRARSRLERWQTIARNASMQAGRDHVPAIEAPQSLGEICATASVYDGLLICWEEANSSDTLDRALDRLLRPELPEQPLRIAVVIGPEGGLRAEEVNALRSANARSAPLTLGPLILRAETAALCALSQIGYELRRRWVR